MPRFGLVVAVLCVLQSSFAQAQQAELMPLPSISGSREYENCRAALTTIFKNLTTGPVYVGGLKDHMKMLWIAGAEKQTLQAFEAFLGVLPKIFKSEAEGTVVRLFLQTMNAAYLRDPRLFLCVFTSDCQVPDFETFRVPDSLKNLTAFFHSTEQMDAFEVVAFDDGTFAKSLFAALTGEEGSARYSMLAVKALAPDADALDVFAKTSEFIHELSHYQNMRRMVRWVLANEVLRLDESETDKLYRNPNMVRSGGAKPQIDLGFIKIYEEGRAYGHSAFVASRLPEAMRGQRTEQFYRQRAFDTISNYGSMTEKVIEEFQITPENIFEVVLEWGEQMEKTISAVPVEKIKWASPYWK